ncbi:MAG: hypothetical protein EBR91_00910 [Flavobacteriia bacterium]|nr:hypothetical protein [Flavobacteriia bacterium]
MRKNNAKTTYYWFSIFALCFLCFQAVSYYIRPNYSGDGALVMGYVDQGGFLNFTGPNVSLSKGHSKWIIGMLPSLRFKESPSTPHNAPIFPSLGAGLTYAYKVLVVQVPMYYNPKTLTANGRWTLGVGLGLRFSYFNKKKS